MRIADAWLVDGLRSAFGRYGGGLAGVEVVDLGAQVVSALIERSAWPVVQLAELNVGMAMIEGGLMVPARQVALAADLPAELPTLTVDRACCSGMTAVALGARAVSAGGGSALALGLESMSRTPRLLRNARWGPKRGDLVLEDLNLLRSPLSGQPIAAYAGKEALDRGVDREAQDQWAIQSHERYHAALTDGIYRDEIVPVVTGGGTFDRDEQPRTNLTMSAMSELPCVYGSPTVTAGNAPGLNDGACAVLVASGDAISATGGEPLAQLVAYHQTAGSPTSAVYLPGVAVARLLAHSGLSPADVDVIEINEAFAATAAVSIKVLAGGDEDLETELAARTNRHGGAVAIGHPTGASGTRIVLAAARELRRVGGTWGVAAICGGFGQTDAMLIRAA